MSNTQTVTVQVGGANLFDKLRAIDAGVEELRTLKRTTRADRPASTRVRTTAPKKPKGEHMIDRADELKAGDRFIVDGEEGVFTFKALAQNGDVKARGGLQGHEKDRAFKIERVYRID